MAAIYDFRFGTSGSQVAAGLFNSIVDERGDVSCGDVIGHVLQTNLCQENTCTVR